MAFKQLSLDLKAFLRHICNGFHPCLSCLGDPAFIPHRLRRTHDAALAPMELIIAIKVIKVYADL
jgi:hypothetical protein